MLHLKGTDKILGKLRQRIKKLKEQAEKKAGPVRRGVLYGVKKEGAAQVMLVQHYADWTAVTRYPLLLHQGA